MQQWGGLCCFRRCLAILVRYQGGIGRTCADEFDDLLVEEGEIEKDSEGDVIRSSEVCQSSRRHGKPCAWGTQHTQRGRAGAPCGLRRERFAE